MNVLSQSGAPSLESEKLSGVNQRESSKAAPSTSFSLLSASFNNPSTGPSTGLSHSKKDKSSAAQLIESQTAQPEEDQNEDDYEDHEDHETEDSRQYFEDSRQEYDDSRAEEEVDDEVMPSVDEYPNIYEKDSLAGSLPRPHKRDIQDTSPLLPLVDQAVLEIERKTTEARPQIFTPANQQTEHNSVAAEKKLQDRVDAFRSNTSYFNLVIFAQTPDWRSKPINKREY